jgi:diguanylate cyclase (GGDEF)-like protein
VAAALLALLAAAGVAMTRLYWVARELSQVDGLTGLLNRRRLMELASTELERSRRYGSALALVSLDLDHFKKINDEHGHAAGDRVLKQVAALCREALRQGDLAGRIGGEEFVLVLPHVDADAAEHLAERLRSLFEHKLSVAPGWPVTASFGVAVFAPGMSLADLLQKADMALYQAKAAGRNRVVMWAQPLS